MDKSLTSVFDFFQYWRNVADPDVEKFFKLFTFLPLDEISAICSGDINKAKEKLAFEVTSIIHGKDEAEKALAGAKAAFCGEGNREMMPSFTVLKSDLEKGIGLLSLMTSSGLTSSNSDARRLVAGNGASINGNVISDVKYTVTVGDLDSSGEIILKAGKKKFTRIIIG